MGVNVPLGQTACYGSIFRAMMSLLSTALIFSPEQCVFAECSPKNLRVVGVSFLQPLSPSAIVELLPSGEQDVVQKGSPVFECGIASP